MWTSDAFRSLTLDERENFFGPKIRFCTIYLSIFYPMIDLDNEYVCIFRDWSFHIPAVVTVVLIVSPYSTLSLILQLHSLNSVPAIFVHCFSVMS